MSESEFECLDEEVKELLRNYRHKKATAYEPCTRKNFMECLIGLTEEFGLLNINYIFNPHIDVENGCLIPDALVTLINSVWTLLHHYKNISAKSESLSEQNHILEQNNKQLNGIVQNLKNKLSLEKNESKACVASAQRIADNSDEMLQKLTETRLKLTQVTKQKEASERSLRNEISRLKLQNDKLLDRIRSRNAPPCSNTCDMTVQQLKEQAKVYKNMIAQLQKSNRELLQEVIHTREELILGGLKHYKLDDKKK